MSTFAQVGGNSLGPVKPKILSIAPEVWTQCKLAGHEARWIHGYRSGGEHGTGLALDFMLPKPWHDHGQWIKNYIWTHRARHGLRWLIWEQTFYSLNTPGGRPMEDRGSATQNHYDHVHAYWAVDPSTYVPKPPDYPARTLYRGLSGNDVAELQAGLNAVFDFTGENLVVDGRFGAATEADVKEYQVLRRLTPDGRVGPGTRRSLAYTSGIFM